MILRYCRRSLKRTLTDDRMLNAACINRYVTFKCHGFLERGEHFSEWVFQLYLNVCRGKTLERLRSFVLQLYACRSDVIFIHFHGMKYRYAAWMIHLLCSFRGLRSEWWLRASGGAPFTDGRNKNTHRLASSGMGCGPLPRKWNEMFPLNSILFVAILVPLQNLCCLAMHIQN